MGWSHPHPTAPAHFFNRRQFIRVVGTAAVGLTLGCRFSPLRPRRSDVLRPGVERPEVLKLFPAARNPVYELGTRLTDPMDAGTYNNFYEFHPGSAGPVWKYVDRFRPDPWTIRVTGLCHKAGKFDIDDIFGRFGAFQEERTYRFRCVERWAMDVPWTGFELNKLLNAVEPTSDARFVRFVSAHLPDQMPGLKEPGFAWPYFEAMNRLTLLATGVYGRYVAHLYT